MPMFLDGSDDPGVIVGIDVSVLERPPDSDWFHLLHHWGMRCSPSRHLDPIKTATWLLLRNMGNTASARHIAKGAGGGC